MNKLIQLTTFPPGMELTLTGMIIPPGLPIQLWEDAYELTSQAKRRKQMEMIALDWAQADLLNYGEKEYGQKYAQAVLITGLSEHTLMNKCWAASKIPLDERREGLSLEHHAAVAALPASERGAWLDQAKLDHSSVLDLRTKVQDRKMRESGKDPLVERAKAALDAAVVALTRLPRSQRVQLIVEKLIMPLADVAKKEREQFLSAVVGGVCDIE